MIAAVGGTVTWVLGAASTAVGVAASAYAIVRGNRADRAAARANEAKARADEKSNQLAQTQQALDALSGLVRTQGETIERQDARLTITEARNEDCERERDVLRDKVVDLERIMHQLRADLERGHA